MNDKILIGEKGKKDAGYAFAPYIKISELILPVRLIGYDKNNNPIFVKND